MGQAHDDPVVQALRRAAAADARADALEEELARSTKLWRAALVAVVAVASVGLLMLGLVAFNAVD